MFCPFFHDFRLFWNSLCCQRDHKFSGTEWHTSSRNRVVRRRLCKIGGFPLCNPFKGLLWDSSEVHSILKYTKCLMFEMWHIYTSVTVFYYSSKDSGPIDMLRKFWVYGVDVFYETVNSSQEKLNRLLRLLWHCALKTICGCHFFQIVAFFDFGNCWFEISVYFIHISTFCRGVILGQQSHCRLFRSYHTIDRGASGMVLYPTTQWWATRSLLPYPSRILFHPQCKFRVVEQKYTFFCSPTFISSLTTSHLNPYYLVDWVIYFDLISSRTCKGQTVSTRLISKQELVLFFNSISTGPPSKEKENKPLTVVGHLQKRNKLTGHKQPAILLQLYLLDIQPI